MDYKQKYKKLLKQTIALACAGLFTAALGYWVSTQWLKTSDELALYKANYKTTAQLRTELHETRTQLETSEYQLKSCRFLYSKGK